MPLPNRVDPFGAIHAVPARGTMMGNRGGRFHRDDKALGRRRWASVHWICCELQWKGAHHEPMGRGYTSLFFLDEVTALAAGHRPCFFCRRKEAQVFLGGERVDDFDNRLHQERCSPSRERRVEEYPRSRGGGLSAHAAPPPPPFGVLPQASHEGEHYPDGVMFADGGIAYAKQGRHLLRWSFDGYVEAIPLAAAMRMNVLTAPTIVAILRGGYQPRWHPTAQEWDTT